VLCSTYKTYDTAHWYRYDVQYQIANSCCTSANSDVSQRPSRAEFDIDLNMPFAEIKQNDSYHYS
jgi:hypothetical protein